MFAVASAAAAIGALVVLPGSTLLGIGLLVAVIAGAVVGSRRGLLRRGTAASAVLGGVGLLGLALLVAPVPSLFGMGLSVIVGAVGALGVLVCARERWSPSALVCAAATLVWAVLAHLGWSRFEVVVLVAWLAVTAWAVRVLGRSVSDLDDDLEAGTVGEVDDAEEDSERARQWRERSVGTQLGGVRLVDHEVDDEGGERFRLIWEPGTSLVVSAVQNSGEIVESLLDLRRGSLSLDYDGSSSTSVLARVRGPAQQHRPFPWDGRVAESISDEIVSARYDDDELEIVQRWVPGQGGYHILRTGMTLSGKSRSIRHAVVVWGPARDALPFVYDGKGGMGVALLKPLLDWLAVTETEAITMLRAVVRIIDARAEFAADQGWEIWQPSPRLPVIIVIVDEIARLVGVQARPETRYEATQLVTLILTLGAGVGVLFDPATQLAIQEALGGLQIEENFGYIECFRLRNHGWSKKFLPHAPLGIDAADLPADRKGSLYIEAGGACRPMVAQKPDVTDEQAQQVVRQHWEFTPELDPVSAAAAGEAYARRTRWVLDEHGAIRPVSEETMTTPQPQPQPVSASQPSPAPAAAEYSAVATATVPAWHDVPCDGPTLRELADAHLQRLSPAEREAESAKRANALTALSTSGDPARAERQLEAFLRESYPTPRSAAEALPATGMSELWNHQTLTTWAGDGRVIHAGYGRYVLANAPGDAASTHTAPRRAG